MGLLLVQVPLKPGVADPLAGILPFQVAFATVTFLARLGKCAVPTLRHGLTTDREVNPRLQLVQAEALVFWTVIFAPNPPVHWFVTV